MIRFSCVATRAWAVCVIVVVAEGPARGGTFTVPDGALDASGRLRPGGIASLIAPEIEERTGFETRVTILGHVQRGGTPNAYDRVLSTRYGLAAIDAVHDHAWGYMVALNHYQIVRVPLHEIAGQTRLVDPMMYEVAELFFG